MTSLQERLFAMQDKQYAAFQAKLTPGVPVESFIFVCLCFASSQKNLQRRLKAKIFFISFLTNTTTRTCFTVSSFPR